MSTQAFDGDKSFVGTLERMDFEPAHLGEDYITITLRVPTDTRLCAGTYQITPPLLSPERTKETGQND